MRQDEKREKQKKVSNPTESESNEDSSNLNEIAHQEHSAYSGLSTAVLI